LRDASNNAKKEVQNSNVCFALLNLAAETEDGFNPQLSQLFQVDFVDFAD